jgi:FKBP-type peptidyl-prolyl cis-trans isomerase FklB
MRFLLVLVSIGLMTSPCLAEKTLDHEDQKAKVNYSVGYQIGGDFKRQGVAINPEALMRGIQDGLSGEKALMTEEERRTTLVNLQRQVADRQAEEYRREGDAFLAENARKEGVRTTKSGLQYKVIEEGTGKSPGATDTVTVNYRGTLIDGEEFDSSYRRGQPANFRVDNVIAGWTEALQMMKEGARWQLFIPADLAYGKKGNLADRTLIFEVELISVDSSG